MSSNKSPTFSSPELQKLYSTVQPGLSTYQARLDQLSNDIRATETVLKVADFNIPVQICLKSTTELAEDAINDVDMVAGTEWHFDEYLHWDNVDGKGFRLYWELFRQDGYIHTEGMMLIERGKRGKPELQERKLLIDCKASKRLEAEPKLQDLLIEVGKCVDPTIREDEARKASAANDEAIHLVNELTKNWSPLDRLKKTKEDITKHSGGSTGKDGTNQ